jgi:glyoxylase-like metal-dependent hydrolase (beta-lactamase superfamily II)
MFEQPITVGDVWVQPLLDATVDYPWPLAQLFPGVPDQAWEPFRERYPDAFGAPDVWRSRYHCYLLRSRDRTILLDTGMGPPDSPLSVAFGAEGQLPQRLRQSGVAPEEIDVVVLSHLHPDHVGGALQSEGGHPRLSFPRARYLVADADWQTFHRPEVQEHFPFPFVAETITPLKTLGALELIAAPYAVTDEVTLDPAPGHTPGHLTLKIDSAGRRAMLVADAFLHPAQITEPDWASMFDMDPEQDRLTRRTLLDRLESEDMLFAASHFPHPSFGRIRRAHGRRYWQPMAESA